MIIPKKIQLANIPTRLQNLEFEGCKFIIKRDDFTGLELTGNKIRKLEYLLHEAKKQKCNYIFTSGGDQSNHARATCIAAMAQGFKSKLFLWGDDRKIADGNLFLDKLTSTEIRFVSKKAYVEVNEIMEADRIKYAKSNKKAYVIPSGGSSFLGIWGYVNFVKELSEQVDLRKIKGIVFANGSCGTAAGIMLGCALMNIKLKIYPVNVLMTEQEVFDETKRLIEGCVDKYKLNVKIDYNNLNILHGYSEEGYKSISDDKVNLIKRFFRSTGILLDPTYTGKAFKAYYDNFLVNKKKTNIMFLHTGGIYGAFAKRKNYLD